MRKLASIRKINNISPIEGADRIELARVDGWDVVVAKNVGYKIGDLVVYFEIDSFLPIEPEFEFLRKSSFKRMGDKEGFRLKTIKLKGQISQGLIIPIEDAINIISRRLKTNTPYVSIEEGVDLTDMLGVEKYEPPIPANLSGEVKSNFPPFISKTDEERVQNLIKKYNQWVELSDLWYVTEKLDGSSSTFYYNTFYNSDDKFTGFGVCSRNLNLKRNDNNSMWKWAIDNDLEEKLKFLHNKYGKSIALQGEIHGEGVQKNPYKLKGTNIRFFNAIDINSGYKFDYNSFRKLIDEVELETVPILDFDFKLPPTVDELLEYSGGKSALNLDVEREGVVIRNYQNTISFKVINNDYLL